MLKLAELFCCPHTHAPHETVKIISSSFFLSWLYDYDLSKLNYSEKKKEVKNFNIAVY